MCPLLLALQTVDKAGGGTHLLLLLLREASLQVGGGLLHQLRLLLGGRGHYGGTRRGWREHHGGCWAPHNWRGERNSRRRAHHGLGCFRQRLVPRVQIRLRPLAF